MKKKKPSQKEKKRSPKKKSQLKRELKRAIIGYAILLVLVIIGGVFIYYLVLRQPVIQPKQPIEESLPEKPSAVQPPFEIYPREKLPPPEPIPKPVQPSEALPNIAIIIDDLGYQRSIADKFISLDANLTLSILPHSPYQESIAQSAHDKGLEIMLHLPMEPKEYPAINPGPGTLLTSMTPDQLIAQLISNLEAVPYIKGVNNHMGSKMTTNSTQMYQIFTVLKKRRLFFVDSRTSANSLSGPSARLFKVPFAQRDVFIDHIPESDFIHKQIALLAKKAKKNGHAIGIAHPHQVTYNILRDSLPDLKRKVDIVPASKLVHIFQ